MARYIAVDLGGGSGRVIAGMVHNGKVEIEEIHRFPNHQIVVGEHLCWDSEALFGHILEGLKLAAQKYDDIVSIGIDSWGVDFALVDERGELVGNTVCYRDQRTEGVKEALFARIDPLTHYLRVGIQQMEINTLFQLLSIDKEQLQSAHRILFTPDYYAYKLCGVMANEYTIASTSELLDATSKSWDHELIQSVGLPEHLFGSIVMPGTPLGEITEEIALKTGLAKGVKVVTVGCHDTASAVASLGQMATDAAFLSSGTWSLLGITTDEPILTKEAFEAGCTNEGGCDGKIRFLQNITGLWMLQSLMKQWQRNDYDQLLAEAEASTIRTIIDVDHRSLVSPSDMQAAIYALCNEEKPVTQGDYVQVVLRSLANRYLQGLDEMERISGRKIKQLYIIGGGVRNKLLSHMIEQVIGRKVRDGESEATSIGNILMQSNIKTI